MTNFINAVRDDIRRSGLMRRFLTALFCMGVFFSLTIISVVLVWMVSYFTDNRLYIADTLMTITTIPFLVIMSLGSTVILHSDRLTDWILSSSFRFIQSKAAIWVVVGVAAFYSLLLYVLIYKVLGL